MYIRKFRALPGIGIGIFVGMRDTANSHPSAPPVDPCDIGTWDFQEECQSGQLLTVGIM